MLLYYVYVAMWLSGHNTLWTQQREWKSQSLNTRKIIIIIIILVITFMHGIYNYIPETNHASVVYIVAAVLYLQFVLHVMLFRMLKVL